MTGARVEMQLKAKAVDIIDIRDRHAGLKGKEWSLGEDRVSGPITLWLKNFERRQRDLNERYTLTKSQKKGC